MTYKEDCLTYEDALKVCQWDILERRVHQNGETAWVPSKVNHVGREDEKVYISLADHFGYSGFWFGPTDGLNHELRHAQRLHQPEELPSPSPKLCPREGCGDTLEPNPERCVSCGYPGLLSSEIPQPEEPDPYLEHAKAQVRLRIKAIDRNAAFNDYYATELRNTKAGIQPDKPKPYQPVFRDPHFCWTCGHAKGCMHPRPAAVKGAD
jgi:hypothetical protein